MFDRDVYFDAVRQPLFGGELDQGRISIRLPVETIDDRSVRA